MKKYIINKLDALGMGVGIACAIHCALFPVLFSSGMFAGIAWLDHVFIDLLFLIASLYFAFNSLIKSYIKVHKNWIPMAIAFAGISLIAFVLLQHKHDQILLPTLGGVLLAVAHFYNYRIASVHSDHSVK